MPANSYRLRKASRNDLDSILRMQVRSMRTLGRNYYRMEAIESALRHVGTMDPEVIDEGQFYVAVAQDGKIIGSGGSSRRVPSYDRIAIARAMTSIPTHGPILVRGVYVCPDWTRRGIAKAIMSRAEATAVAEGATEISLTATLSGVPLYRALGYRALRPKRIRFPDGIVFDAVEMSKKLSTTERRRGTKTVA